MSPFSNENRILFALNKFFLITKNLESVLKIDRLPKRGSFLMPNLKLLSSVYKLLLSSVNWNARFFKLDQISSSWMMKVGEFFIHTLQQPVCKKARGNVILLQKWQKSIILESFPKPGLLSHGRSSNRVLFWFDVSYQMALPSMWCFPLSTTL